MPTSDENRPHSTSCLKAAASCGHLVRHPRPTYRAAIEWIAAEDNPGDADPEEALRGYLTVALVADLFGVSCERVAKDVAVLRTPEKPKTSP